MTRICGAHPGRLRHGAKRPDHGERHFAGRRQYLLRPFFGGGEQFINGELEYFNDYNPHDQQTPRLVTLPESRFVSLAGFYTDEERRTPVTYNELLPRSGYMDGLDECLNGPDGSCIF